MKASELSHRLGLNAEAVCRRYLSNGRKAGRYWQVGNAQNEKGQSLFVRLAAPGVVGKWNDAATGEHGDLLDMIQTFCGLPDLRSAMAEAERFLGCSPEPPPASVRSMRATCWSAKGLNQPCPSRRLSRALPRPPPSARLTWRRLPFRQM